MSVMTMETLNEFKEVSAVRIGKGKSDGHNSVLLKGIVNGIDV